MPDPESDLFGDVYYEPSDSVAIFEESGVVRMEPILLQRSTIPNHTEPAYFVLTSGRYFPAEALPNFIRYEKVPSARPKPKCTPLLTFVVEPRMPEVETKSILERLVEAQARWEQEKRNKR